MGDDSKDHSKEEILVMPLAEQRQCDPYYHKTVTPMFLRLRPNSQRDKPIHSLVDTGANLSVITKALLRDLQGGDLHYVEKETVIQGLGDVVSPGYVHMTFFLDGKIAADSTNVQVQVETTVFVLEEFGPGFALGMDTIAHYGMCLTPTLGVATIECPQGNAEIPIFFSRRNLPPRATWTRAEANNMASWSKVFSLGADPPKPVPVRVLQDTTVPPRSERFIRIKRLPGQPTMEWEFSPFAIGHPERQQFGSSPHALLATMASGGSHAGISFVNASDTPMLLPEGLELGEVKPRDIAPVLHSGEMYHIYKGSRRSRPKDAKGSRIATRRAGTAPTHRPQSYSLSITHLDPGDDEEDIAGLEQSREHVSKDVPSETVNGCRIAKDPGTGKAYSALADVVKRWESSFTDGKPGHVTVGEPVRIPLKDDADLKPAGLRPLGPLKRAEEEKYLKQMLEWGIIEESSSRYSFPVVIVRQGEKFRYCINYRNLNTVTIPDVYPMQRADQIFSSLTGCRFFSSLDAARGYHQLPLDEQDKEKTAFVTHFGLYQYKSMPFGLRNAPAIFQKFMDRFILGSLRWQTALVYIDNIIIYTKTLAEHAVSLDKILAAATATGLKFSSAKCFIGYPSLRLLGRMITQEGFTVIEDKVKAVLDMPLPRTAADLGSSLGSFGYYQSFIIDYARRALPLRQLQTAAPSDSAALEWTAESKAAFEDLKKALATPPVLSYPVMGALFILYVDACKKGIGAVLHQLVPASICTAFTEAITSDDLISRLVKATPSDKTFGPKPRTLKAGGDLPGYLLGKRDVLVITTESIQRLCLPKSMVKEVFEDFHDHMGHPGMERCWQAICVRFYRPGLATSLRNHVRSCEACQKAKPDRHAPAGEMDAELPEPVAFQKVSVDLVTGLPPSSSRQLNACLIVVDIFTKMVILAPCHDTLTADQLAQLWFDNVSRRGFHPSVIVSDQGPQFVAAAWKGLQAKLGTTCVYSAAYHQQANPVERYCASEPTSSDPLAAALFFSRRRSAHLLVNRYTSACTW